MIITHEIIVGIIEIYLSSLSYIAFETFTAIVADPIIPGTFMNVIAALGNLSTEWSSTLSLYLTGIYPKSQPYFLMLVIFGSLYSITFLSCTKNWLAEKEKNLNEWKFSDRLKVPKDWKQLNKILTE